MRHQKNRRKLGRVTSHRYAMLRNLVTSLFDSERVVTTVAKAKEVRPMAEKLITIAKKESLHARRRVLRVVRDKRVVAKLFDTLSARFATRPGGYTRIILTGTRLGDGAQMAILELLDSDWYRQKADREKEKKARAKGGKPDKEDKSKAKEEKAKDEKKPAKEPKEKKAKAAAKPKASPKDAKEKPAKAPAKKASSAAKPKSKAASPKAK